MLFDLLLVMLGFGFIVFVHELGHFVAARWAGIRVLAFAIGFGPPLLTFRKGLGIRRGSTEREYFERFREHHQRLADRSAGDLASRTTGGVPELGISPTEYRLNALPFGGYVKMLGQNDMDARSTSAEPDSYQLCAPWKRMVVISAGVIMNLIVAAILFIIVMMAGRMVEPSTIGSVRPGSPAAMATPLDDATRTVFAKDGPGLRSGDRVMSIDGDSVRTFDDVFIGVAMSRSGSPIELEVRRPGVEQLLRMQALPNKTILSPFLDLGVDHASGPRLIAPAKPSDAKQVATLLEESGLTGVQPGASLVAIRVQDGPRIEPATGSMLAVHIERSEGKPVLATFVNPDGSRHDVTIQPEMMLQRDIVATSAPASSRAASRVANLEHVLGLTGVMMVRAADTPAAEQGLLAGDIFAKIGDVEYPAFHEGLQAIRTAKGRSLPITVLRATGEGVLREVHLPAVKIRRDGTIGFTATTTSTSSALIARPVEALTTLQGTSVTTASAALSLPPGTRIVSVDRMPVASLLDVRSALAVGAERSEGQGWDVELGVVLPHQGLPGDGSTIETVTWPLGREEAKSLLSQAWTSKVQFELFEPEREVLKAKTPWEALGLGMRETKRVMLSTYLTFVRLAQGSVAFDQLKGPVGIAHIGTIVSGRGFIWLLFFLAMISVNLAVVNFLPLPIVDGGQFLFLVYEAIRGKPVPVGVQNVVTMAGLVMIGSLFLMVTYNDIRNLLGI